MLQRSAAVQEHLEGFKMAGLGSTISSDEPIRAAIRSIEARIAAGEEGLEDQLAALKKKLEGAGSGAIAGDSDKK